MPLDDILRSLLTAHGPSGYESAPAAAWRKACEPFAEVQVDVMGSCTATVPGTAGGLTVAIVGHIDEIGLVVTHITEKGFLRFTGIGGWDPQVLVGQRVVVSTRDGAVPGVIGNKPPHLSDPEDRKKAAELKNLHIDIGAKDADDARKLVRVGDVAVIDGDPIELPNDRVVSRSMDNRLGCYVALQAAKLVADAGGAPGDVVAVAAVQEEITFGGARTVAHALKPDVAIVVDVGHETDAPGVEPGEIGEHAFGSGPIIERGSTLHPAVFEALHDAAEATGESFTIAASAGRTGTDADAIHLSRAGIPTGLVGLPLRYMHSAVEMVQLSDVHAAAQVIAEFCRALEPGTTFAR
jgi:putative aminopeptidase FrvX